MSLIIFLSFLGILAIGAIYNPRLAFLAAYIYVTFGLASLPLSTLFPDSRNVGVIIQLSALGAALTYPIIAREMWRFGNLLFSYAYLLVAFTVLLGAYIPVANYYPYGIDKFFIFTLRAFLMIIGLSLLAPFKPRECLVISATIIYAAFLIGTTAYSFSDFDLGRADIQGMVGPITIARTIGAGIFLALVNLMTLRWRAILTIPIFGSAAIILFTLSVITGSRGPLVSTVIALIPVFLFSRHLKLLTRTTSLIVVFFILTFTVVILLQSELSESIGFNRLLYLLHDGSFGTSELTRFYLASAALQGFVESNGLGLGTGGFAAWLGQEKEWPHNIVLEVLTELGIPGIALLTTMLSITIRRWFALLNAANRLSTSEMGVGSLWIYFLLNALVSYDVSSNFHFWISMTFPWLVGNTPALSSNSLGADHHRISESRSEADSA